MRLNECRGRSIDLYKRYSALLGLMALLALAPAAVRVARWHKQWIARLMEHHPLSEE